LFLEANTMKKYAIPVVVVLAVLAVTWSAFAQAQDRAGQRERMQNMSEEERAKFREEMRARFENMSEEERAKFREQMRARGGGTRSSGPRGSRMNAENQQKAIKAIEAALVKVKAAAQIQRPQGGYQNMSEEDRNKLMTAFRDRTTALNAIVAQVALLQGRRPLRRPLEGEEGEGDRFMILSTSDLTPIQRAATKEKAEETGKLIQALIARGTGRGFGPGGGRRQDRGGGQRRQREQ
jgi:hypothetical protein